MTSCRTLPLKLCINSVVASDPLYESSDDFPMSKVFTE